MTAEGPPSPRPSHAHQRPVTRSATLRGWVKAASPLRQGLLVLCVLLATVGAVLLVLGLRGQQHAPRPTSVAAAAAPSGSRSATPAGPGATAARPPQATTAEHTAFHVDIAAINVHSDLISLGLNDNRTIQVPPLSKVSVAGWYKYAPMPGALGPAIILGHIDSAQYGRGVFFNLGALKRGSSISVSRPDHQLATFAVDRVVEVSKSAFPTKEIYGNTPNAQLRLITCGGTFDRRTGSYLDNVVVFATLTKLAPQPPG